MKNILSQKQILRAQIKHQRNTLTKPFMERSALAILGHISSANIIEQANNIAFYLPHNGELSCWPLIEYALSLDKHCYVPKVFPNKKRGMWFLPYQGKDTIKAGAYGILEPTAKTCSAIRPSELDIIFMPLVAYDGDGNRLGMGGGYYDTVLGNFKNNQLRPTLIGLAYNFQQSPSIPTEKWDQKLDAIVTPSYFRRFEELDD